MKAIMYHYVRPDDTSLPHFRHLHVDDFERQLDYFDQAEGFISLDDLCQAFRSRRAPERGVVLTFDDGLKDHYRYVMPALLRRGLQAIFYVATSPYETGRLLDVHRLHVMIGRHGGRTVFESMREMISDDLLSHAHVEEFRNETYLRQHNDDYTRHVKRTLNYYVDYAHREAILDQLMACLVPDELELTSEFYLSEQELSEMQSAGMMIGSHSRSHPVFSKLSVEEQQREISESFARLDRAVGKLGTRTFCYPYGGFHTFTTETERLLESEGVDFSFNVEPRDIGVEDLDRRQALPRFDCNAFPHGSCRQALADAHDS